MRLCPNFVMMIHMISVFKSCHYEILKPDEKDLVFYFQGQEIFLIHSDQVPNYREFSACSVKAKHFYCFAEFENIRYLVAEELEVSQEDPALSKVSLRKLAHTFPADFFALLLKAAHLNFWRMTHRYCGACGTRLIDSTNECARCCEGCGQVSYPRISPCVIVLIRRGAEMLLARSAHFAPGVYSTLAGFIEPGESAEDAVHREIFEEVGLRVNNVRYFASQAWPFPDSLMLGFTADYESGEICIDKKEIEAADWYSPKNLPTLPNTFSIARALIDHHLRLQEK